MADSRPVGYGHHGQKMPAKGMDGFFVDHVCTVYI